LRPEPAGRSPFSAIRAVPAGPGGPIASGAGLCLQWPQEDPRSPLPTKGGVVMLRTVLGLLAAVLFAAPAWSQKEIPWGTSAVGSAGHKSLVVLAELLNREMPKYRVTVQPAPGAIVT